MTLWEANERYEGIREVARDFALQHYIWDVFVDDFTELAAGLRLSAIDNICLSRWHANPAHWNYAWDEWVTHFRRQPSRFEVAIWRQDELAGLAIGRVSDGPDNVTIHCLERCRNHTVLKGWIASIITDVAESYGKALGKQRVKLKDPVKEAIPHYEALGFSLAENVKTTTYYARRIP